MSLVCEPNRSAYACCLGRDKDRDPREDTGSLPIERKSQKACYEHVIRSSSKSLTTSSSISDLNSFRSSTVES